MTLYLLIEDAIRILNEATVPVPPRVYLSRPLSKQFGPRQRIYSLICRISKSRVVWGDEAELIARRCAYQKRWSGNPSHTAKSFEYREKDGRFVVATYFLNGQEKRKFFDWHELIQEAKRDKVQFCMMNPEIRLHRASIQIKRTTTMINRLRDEVKNANKEHRATSAVSC